MVLINFYQFYQSHREREGNKSLKSLDALIKRPEFHRGRDDTCTSQKMWAFTCCAARHPVPGNACWERLEAGRWSEVQGWLRTGTRWWRKAPQSTLCCWHSGTPLGPERNNELWHTFNFLPTKQIGHLPLKHFCLRNKNRGMSGFLWVQSCTFTVKMSSQVFWHK